MWEVELWLFISLLSHGCRDIPFKSVHLKVMVACIGNKDVAIMGKGNAMRINGCPLPGWGQQQPHLFPLPAEHTNVVTMKLPTATSSFLLAVALQGPLMDRRDGMDLMVPHLRGVEGQKQ